MSAYGDGLGIASFLCCWVLHPQSPNTHEYSTQKGLEGNSTSACVLKRPRGVQIPCRRNRPFSKGQAYADLYSSGKVDILIQEEKCRFQRFSAQCHLFSRGGKTCLLPERATW